MGSGTDPFPIGDVGPSNRRDGEFTGPLFPEWGDPTGSHGQLVMLRMEAVEGTLPPAPILLRKSVEAYLGARVDGAYPESRGASYVLKLRNKSHVEKLKKMSMLADGFPIRIVEHPVLNISKCVISCNDSCVYSDDELTAELQAQGVKEVRRITRRDGGKLINTPTIILTINGTVVPESIFIGWIRCRTRPFYPSPMICYCCWEFGHTRTRCQNTANPTCGNCSGNHVIVKEHPCTSGAFCKRCNSANHSIASRKCPAYIKEEEIQHIRVDMGISYPAAKRQHDLRHNPQSMASVVAAGNDQRFAELSAKVDNLVQEVKRKDDRVETLLTEIRNKDAHIERLEAALKLTPQERLTMVKEHGTIKDMVQKIRSLESELARKEKEVAVMRDVYVPKKALNTTANNTAKTPAAVSEPCANKTNPTSKKTSTKKKVVKTDDYGLLNKRSKNCVSPIDTSEPMNTSINYSPESGDIEISSGDEPMLNASGYISDS